MHSDLLRDLSIAGRNVLRQRRRSTMAVSAIAFGVVALLLAGGFIEWVYWAMREDTIHSHLGHVQVVRPRYLEAGLADPFRYLLADNAPERSEIEKLPRVRTVAPRLGFSGLISRGDSTISFLGDGVDPEKEDLLSRTLMISRGYGLDRSDPSGIILGDGLAANLGADVGDQLVLVANTRSGGVNAVEVHVRGLFSTPTKAYDDVALRLPLAKAQELLKTNGTHRWLVLLDDTRATEATMAVIRQQLAGKPFDVVPWYDLADFYNKTVALFQKQVNVMKAIIAAIIVLSISNILMMSVLERTGEIGTVMALGHPRRRVMRLFLAEGLVLGVAGIAVGLVLGAGLAALISSIGIPMPPPPGMARGFTGAIRLTPSLAFDAVLLAVGTALAASIYPAWKGSRLEIVDALRHNR
jgi:putative ABC transport system permease protein